jgi:hypothetical protein
MVCRPRLGKGRRCFEKISANIKGVDDRINGYLWLALCFAIDCCRRRCGTQQVCAGGILGPPALLDDNLDAFEDGARREFPEGVGTWVLVADVNGQQLVNTLAHPGEPLPHRNPLAIEAQQRAFRTGSIVVSDVLKGPAALDWIANIEVPIFKNGQPFRRLTIIMRVGEFLPLLSIPDIPTNWLVGIMDGQGRYIARVPQGQAHVGQLASQGWRAIKDQIGLFEFPSLEGAPLIHANARPSVSNWTIGVAVKKAELQAAAWCTVRWAILLGAAISAASLLLPGILARQITRKIESLRQSFAGMSEEPAKPIMVIELQALRSTSCRTRPGAVGLVLPGGAGHPQPRRDPSEIGEGGDGRIGPPGHHDSLGLFAPPESR